LSSSSDPESAGAEQNLSSASVRYTTSLTSAARWWQRTPMERLAAIDIMRRVIYGRTAAD
jgi:hypothetical protein